MESDLVADLLKTLSRHVGILKDDDRPVTETLRELSEMFDHYAYVHAVYSTAVIQHDLDDACDCETCAEYNEIRSIYGN